MFPHLMRHLRVARAGTVRSLMRAAPYSAMSANMPNTSLPWAVVVSTTPLVSD